ncbi:uncharacterized protein LOC143919761 [Arctopsyche grandis]|uniref:uncharacterized protein LOC143919761 n=1 Tax=Arctopsyche grandis TaxID=121162 RepID=UPI00406D92B2
MSGIGVPQGPPGCRPRKPRSMRGTPLGKLATKHGLVFIAVSTAVGAFLQFSDYAEKVRLSFEPFYESDEDAMSRITMGAMIYHPPSELLKKRMALDEYAISPSK